MSYLGRSAKLSLKAQEKVSFLATAGQTSKTGLSYVPSFVEVYVNGILLTDTTDFTATNGNSVTFTVALALNDEVTVISLKTFSVAESLSKAGGTMTGDTLHGDNVKAKFGASDDLQIYHDGANSYIKEAGTGDLIVLGNNVQLRNTAFEYYLTCITDAGVTAYYNNVAKLATTSTGVDVTGTVTSDGLVTTGSESSNQSRVTVAPNDNQNRTLLITEQKIEATAPSGYTNVQQGIDFAPASGYMKLNVGNAERMRIDSSGNVTKPYQPAFRAYHNIGSQSVAGGDTKIPFTIATLNAGNHYNASTSTFTAPVTGNYYLNWFSIYNGAASNEWALFVFSAGSNRGTKVHFSNNNANWHNVRLSGVYPMTAGSTVYVANGGNTVVYHGGTWSGFSGHLIG